MNGAEPPGAGLENEPVVVAITVTYADRNELVLTTVRAALRAGATRALVVANGSTPPVLKDLRRGAGEIGPVEIVPSADNLGSAGGFRLGLARARDQDSMTHVWLLDDDNRAEPGSLASALGTLAASPVRLSAAACYRPCQDPQRRVVAGEAVLDVYDAPGSALYFDLRRRLRPRASSPSRAGSIPIPAAPYGGLLLPRRLLERIGLPATDFFLYGDDYDYTSRIERVGGVILLDPGARIVDSDHAVVAAELEQTSSLRPFERLLRTPEQHQYRVFYRIRNDLVLDRRRVRTVSTALLFLLNLSIVLGGLGLFAVKDRRNRAVARVVLAGIRAGWAGHLGSRGN